MMQPNQTALPRQIILPTQHLVDNFLAETAVMSNLDYDIDEVLNNAFNAIALVPDIQLRMEGFTQMYLRWGEGKNTYGIPDGLILSNAFANLVRGLLDIYKRAGMWGNDGFCPYYYVDQDYRDCILNRLED